MKDIYIDCFLFIYQLDYYPYPFYNLPEKQVSILSMLSINLDSSETFDSLGLTVKHANCLFSTDSNHGGKAR